VPYTQTTWLSLQTALQDRLDSKGVFYSNTGTYPEIQLYLKEALRAWNSFAFRWRQRITVTFGPGAQWFDIHSATPMQKTITDTQLVAEIQAHLLEPITGSTWTGSDMFTLSEITSAMQKRRDQLILESGVEQDITTLNVTPTQGRFEFPNNIIDIRRLAWIDQITGKFTPLWRTDPWAATANLISWSFNVASKPVEYSLGETPPLQCQLIPSPANPGQIECIMTPSGPTLNPSAGVVLGIHDDLCWSIKWGTIADLLSKNNQARDPQRASYAESRYREGVQLAEVLPHVMMAQINGKPSTIIPTSELDANNPDWENTIGTPIMLGINHHLMSLYPRPAANVVVTLDVLRPAPIPAVDGDFVQLGQEELNALLDYAQHIATFKEGGVEFEATKRNKDNFLTLAGNQNDKLNALEFYREWMEPQSDKEEERTPRRSKQDGD
jgi:hypothetical protein